MTGHQRSYHHGDLPRVLVAEAVALAGAGGPEAVTLREVARRAGVSATAVYRHFADREALLAEVAREARQALAGRMLAERAAEPRRRSPTRAAVARFRATGRGYVAFATEQPHLIRTAFLPLPPASRPDDPDAYAVLTSAIDELVASGAMPARHRPGAEVLAWSSVHGFGLLAALGGLGATGPGGAAVDGAAVAVDRAAVDLVLDGVGRALGVTTT